MDVQNTPHKSTVTHSESCATTAENGDLEQRKVLYQSGHLAYAKAGEGILCTQLSTCYDLRELSKSFLLSTTRPMKVLSLHTVSALFIVYALFGEFIECSSRTAKVLHH